MSEGTFSNREIDSVFLYSGGRDALPHEGFLADEIAGVPQRFKSSRVGPPAIEDFASQLAVAQVRIVHVGNLQLAAAGWLQRADAVKNGRIVEIRPDYRVRRARRRGLLFDAHKPVVIDSGTTEAFRIGHFLQQNHSSGFLRLESLARLLDAGLDDVAAQNDADALSLGKTFRQTQRVGDSSFTFLISKTHLLQSKILPIAEQPQKIPRATASGNDQNVANPCFHQCLQREINHRLVIYRQQMLVRHSRERKEP